jgi:hypothetical protein
MPAIAGAAFVLGCQDAAGRSGAQVERSMRESEMTADAQQVVVLDGAEITRRV